METLLKNYGFANSETPNLFIKNNYKAVVWKNGSVTITRYTPKHGRYLGSKTFKTQDDLKKELGKNH